MMKSFEFFNLGLNYDAYSWSQLSKIAQVDDKTVRYWFKRNGITKKPSTFRRKTIDNNNDIINLTNEGYSSSQIAELLGLTTRQVTTAKDARKLKTNKFDKVVLNYLEEQVVIGSILGDGCIEIQNRKRGYHRLTIKHCEKQREYVLFKYKLLKRISNNVREKFKVDSRPRFKDHVAVYLRTVVNPVFTEYRNNWYSPNKVIYEPDLYKLDGLGIAIWYMDDGYTHGNSYYFCTNCFNIEDLVKIQIMFRTKFDINISIQRDHVIHVLSDSTVRSESLILPFIIPTMTYKVRVKSLELLENLEAGNQQPNLMNDIEVIRKVQRLTGEESTNKPDTSEGQLEITDDIV